MLDHIGFAVRDFDSSKLFYQQALPAIGITLQLEVTAEQTGSGAHAGFGTDGKPFFWIGGGTAPNSAVHVAFAAETRGAVRAFYEAALTAGGSDNGAPGLRPHYHANYYAAFVLDPDGNNIEAVCHSAS